MDEPFPFDACFTAEAEPIIGRVTALLAKRAGMRQRVRVAASALDVLDVVQDHFQRAGCIVVVIPEQAESGERHAATFAINRSGDSW